MYDFHSHIASKHKYTKKGSDLDYKRIIDVDYDLLYFDCFLMLVCASTHLIEIIENVKYNKESIMIPYNIHAVLNIIEITQGVENFYMILTDSKEYISGEKSIQGGKDSWKETKNRAEKLMLQNKAEKLMLQNKAEKLKKRNPSLTKSGIAELLIKQCNTKYKPGYIRKFIKV